MDPEAGLPDPVEEELASVRRASGWFWFRQGLLMPDFGEIAGGWAGLRRSGKWAVVALVLGLIMLVPVVGIAVALLS